MRGAQRRYNFNCRSVGALLALLVTLSCQGCSPQEAGGSAITLLSQTWKRATDFLWGLLQGHGGGKPASGTCSAEHEDCSHTECCSSPGYTCYRKDEHYAGCLQECTAGEPQSSDPPERRSPWQCTPLTPSEQDCAKSGEDCSHLGCCVDKQMKCFRKDAHWASCSHSCIPGLRLDDPIEYRTPWSCHQILPGGGLIAPTAQPPATGSTTAPTAQPPATGSTSGAPPAASPTPAPSNWQHGLQATHFWDCNGGSCDAPTLQPWDPKMYTYAPQYAPTDPAQHGGAMYGERLWMTGAASDALSALLGPDSDCCGTDTAGGGGCGRCLLVRNPEARHADWTVVVMKKNRCPPHSHGCDKIHLDMAAPAHDNLGYSTANVCGDPGKVDTYISRVQSGLCGGGGLGACDCSALPSSTPAQRMLREGCRLFREWGWTTGNPKLHFQPVACPAGFVKHISSAFGAAGVQDSDLQQKMSAITKKSFGALAPQRRPFAVVSLLVCCAAALVAAVLVLSRLTRGHRSGEGGCSDGQLASSLHCGGYEDSHEAS